MCTVLPPTEYHKLKVSMSGHCQHEECSTLVHEKEVLCIQCGRERKAGCLLQSTHKGVDLGDLEGVPGPGREHCKMLK